MASLNINVPHELPQEEALSRIKTLLTKLKEEQKDTVSNVKEEWTGNKGNFAFSAKGFDIDGLISVNDGTVDIDAKLPFALSFFKGSILKFISEKAKQLLAP